MVSESAESGWKGVKTEEGISAEGASDGFAAMFLCKLVLDDDATDVEEGDDSEEQKCDGAAVYMGMEVLYHGHGDAPRR